MANSPNLPSGGARQIAMGQDMTTAVDAARQNAMTRLRPTKNDPAAADKTAREFEAMFLSQMLQPLFKDLKTAKTIMGGGHGEEVFSGLLVDEYAKTIAKNGGVGIAAMVRREIDKMQQAGEKAAQSAATQATAAQAVKAYKDTAGS
jgi:peptidoglycan hydrolase FlgJ